LIVGSNLGRRGGGDATLLLLGTSGILDWYVAGSPQVSIGETPFNPQIWTSQLYQHLLEQQRYPLQRVKESNSGGTNGGRGLIASSGRERKEEGKESRGEKRSSMKMLVLAIVLLVIPLFLLGGACSPGLGGCGIAILTGNGFIIVGSFWPVVFLPGGAALI
jgi:hypothetical protein